MSIPVASDEVLQLFEAVLSQCANEAEVQRLEKLLNEDGQVRLQFALVSQLDADLRYLYRDSTLDSEQSLANVRAALTALTAPSSHQTSEAK